MQTRFKRKEINRTAAARVDKHHYAHIRQLARFKFESFENKQQYISLRIKKTHPALFPVKCLVDGTHTYRRANIRRCGRSRIFASRAFPLRYHRHNGKLLGLINWEAVESFPSASDNGAKSLSKLLL